MLYLYVINIKYFVYKMQKKKLLYGLCFISKSTGYISFQVNQHFCNHMISMKFRYRIWLLISLCQDLLVSYPSLLLQVIFCAQFGHLSGSDVPNPAGRNEICKIFLVGSFYIFSFKWTWLLVRKNNKNFYQNPDLFVFIYF